MIRNRARSVLALACGVVALGTLGIDASASAQARTSEEQEVRHVYDETPEWEAEADADVTLVAPTELTICRQGRIVVQGGVLFAHMGCWPDAQRGETVRRMTVPSGLAYVGVHRGLDLEWIGSGVSIYDGSILRVRASDNLPIRVAGWALFGVSLITAVVCPIGMVQNWFGSTDGPPIVVTSVAGALVFVGLGLAFVNDGLELSVGGQTSPPPS